MILLHIVMQRPLDSHPHQDSSLDESQDSAASTAASIELETLGYINTEVCRLSFSDSPRSIDDYYQTAFTNAYQVDYLVMIMALGFSNVGDATELFSIGYVLADSDFQQSILGGEMHNKAATVAGMSSVGLIVGGLGIWVFEMYLGRKPTVLLGLCCTTLAGVLGAVSTNLFGFLVGRFLCGLGMGAILSSQPALATECAPPKERGWVVSLANSFWTLGLILNAVSAYIIFGILQLSWRVFIIVSTMPSALGLLLIWRYVPESARYLALHGNYVQAANSANRITSAMGYKGTPIKVEEIKHHYGSTTGRQESSRSIIKSTTSNMRQIYGPTLWKQTSSIQMIWIYISVGSSLAFWINTLFKDIGIANVYLSFLVLNISCIPGNIASVTLVDRIGRRPFMSVVMSVASCSLLVFAYFASSSESKTTPIVCAACIYYAALTAGWTTLYVMAAETFPTNIRATGLALCATGGRIASILAQYINGALLDRPATLLCVGAAILGLACLTTAFSPIHEMARQAIADTVKKDGGHSREHRTQTKKYLSID